MLKSRTRSLHPRVMIWAEFEEEWEEEEEEWDEEEEWEEEEEEF
ncbi:MAG: hypothetical protein QXX29_00710 [Nitrososphaerota archaeon]